MHHQPEPLRPGARRAQPGSPRRRTAWTRNSPSPTTDRAEKPEPSPRTSRIPTHPPPGEKTQERGVMGSGASEPGIRSPSPRARHLSWSPATRGSPGTHPELGTPRAKRLRKRMDHHRKRDARARGEVRKCRPDASTGIGGGHTTIRRRWQLGTGGARFPKPGAPYRRHGRNADPEAQPRATTPRTKWRDGRGPRSRTHGPENALPRPGSRQFE